MAATLSMSPTDEFLILHRRLGHIPFMKLGQLYPSLYGKVDKGKLVCDACEFGKHIRSSYLLSDNRSAKPFQTIHSDVWGPSGVVSINGYRYFVTFIDCCTRTTWLYVLRNKNDVFECFRDFHNLVMNQYNAQLQIFRTDNGTEYVNKLFDEYLSSFYRSEEETSPAHVNPTLSSDSGPSVNHHLGARANTTPPAGDSSQSMEPKCQTPCLHELKCVCEGGP